MAIFNIDSINAINENSDMKKVKSYIFQLNDQLEYMFSNITPEDNYSQKAFAQYKTDGERVTEISASVDGIRLTMATKDNIVSMINLSTEGVKIKGKVISLEGTVTANNNFVIHPDGSMEAKAGFFQGTINASLLKGGTVEGNDIKGNTMTANTLTSNTISSNEIKGNTISGNTISGNTISGNNINSNTLTGNTINAGTINGSTINGGIINGEMEINCGPNFWVREVGNNRAYDIGFGRFVACYEASLSSHVLASDDGKIRLIEKNGNIECNDIYLTDSYMNGWGLIQTIRDLYDKIANLGG